MAYERYGGKLLLLKASGVNLNTTGDVTSFLSLPADLEILEVSVGNWSSTPGALLTFTFRDAATGGGNSLVGSVAGLNAIITSTSLIARGLPTTSALSAVQRVTTSSLYVNVSAANGSALTADIHILVQNRVT